LAISSGFSSRGAVLVGAQSLRGRTARLNERRRVRMILVFGARAPLARRERFAFGSGFAARRVKGKPRRRLYTPIYAPAVPQLLAREQDEGHLTAAEQWKTESGPQLVGGCGSDDYLVGRA